MPESFIRKFCAKYNIGVETVEYLFSLMENRIFDSCQNLADSKDCNEDRFYIITQGVWRGYRLLDGEEQTLWLMCEEDVVLVPTAGYIIESVSESKALCISKTKLDEICKCSHTISNLIRVLFEHQYTNTLNWLTYLCLPTAEERYLTILRNEPNLLQQVPLKHIASFLGVTPQSLSRIRRKIGNR